jgi:uncharacterized RDD family membrane protein YckC
MNDRLKAVLIDGGMALLPIFLAFPVGLFFTDAGDPARAHQASRALIGVLPLWLLAYCGAEAVLGRTLGKRLAKIVVRTAAGARASPGALLTRWLAKFIWLLIGPAVKWMGDAPVGAPVTYLTWLIVLIGFAWAAGPARQALWDKLAGTAVFRG